MITGLPEQFVEAITSKSRRPITLCEFEIGSTTYYLSDTRVELDGIQYLPIVADWGTVANNTTVHNLLTNDSLEAETQTISIINSEESRHFILDMVRSGVMNSTVRIYQWAHNLLPQDRVLIDVMMCQEPIQLKEATMTVKIDLVSVIMTNNQYLSYHNQAGEAYSTVIGRAPQMRLINLQTARYTTTADNIPGPSEEGGDDAPTGLFLIANGIGFPGSGVVFIDSEKMAYDAISASGIHVTERGVDGTAQRPHSPGAMVTIPGEDYDYAVCNGPIDRLENLRADGEEYINPYEFLPNQNPVIVRFKDRPPWLRVDLGSGGIIQPPDEFLDRLYGNSTESANGDTAPLVSSPQAILVGSGSASLSITSEVTGEQQYATEMGASSQSTQGGGAYAPVGAGNINNTTHEVSMQISDETPSHNESQRVWVPEPTDSENTSEFCSTEPDKLCLNGNELGIHTNITQKGVTGSMRFLNIDDFSHLGEFSYAEVIVEWGMSYNKYSKSTVKVYTVSNGSRTLAQESVTDAPSDEIVYNELTGTMVYPLSAKSWADFVEAGIEVEYINDEQYMAPEPSKIAGKVHVSDVTVVAYYMTAEVAHPYQEVVSYFGRDLSSWGDLKNVQVEISYRGDSDCRFSRQAVLRFTNNPDDNYVLGSLPDASGQVARTFNLNLSSWEDLRNARVGIFHQVTDDCLGCARNLNTYPLYVKWRLTFELSGDVPQPWQELVAHYGKDESGRGTLKAVEVIIVTGSSAQCISEINLIKRFDNDPANNEVVDTISPGGISAHGPYDLGIDSWEQLADLRFGIHQ
jgi:hypothetical protein